MAADTRKLLTQIGQQREVIKQSLVFQIYTFICTAHTLYVSCQFITEVRGVHEGGASVRSQLP